METKQTNVLIVDDHPGIRHAIKACLARDERFRLAGEIGRGADLPRALQRCRPDLVVLDLELERGHNPADGVAQIRELAPEARIVVYTGHGDFETVTGMLNLGVDGYILKTDNMSEVVQAIRLIDAGEMRFSGSLSPILAAGDWKSNALNLVERSVLQMLADGMSTRRIAAYLHRAPRTVRQYVADAMTKLQARSWCHALAIAMRKLLVV